MSQKNWASFAQIFGIRCLSGDTRTFFQASRSCLAYICRGVLMFKREKPTRKNKEKHTHTKKKHTILKLVVLFANCFPSTVCPEIGPKTLPATIQWLGLVYSSTGTENNPYLQLIIPCYAQMEILVKIPGGF